VFLVAWSKLTSFNFRHVRKRMKGYLLMLVQANADSLYKNERSKSS
jgi:hypothetical protein